MSDSRSALFEQAASAISRGDERGLAAILEADNKSNPPGGGVLPLVRHTDEEGRTLVHLAATGDNPLLLEPLLLHKADFEARDDNGDTPLGRAIRSGSAVMVSKLAELGASPHGAINAEGMNPYEAIIRAGHPEDVRGEMIRAIRVAGYALNPRNADGETPLIIAVKLGDMTSFEALTRGNETNPFIEDRTGKTAFDYVVGPIAPVLKDQLYNTGQRFLTNPGLASELEREKYGAHKKAQERREMLARSGHLGSRSARAQDLKADPEKPHQRPDRIPKIVYASRAVGRPLPPQLVELMNAMEAGSAVAKAQAAPPPPKQVQAPAQESPPAPGPVMG